MGLLFSDELFARRVPRGAIAAPPPPPPPPPPPSPVPAWLANADPDPLDWVEIEGSSLDDYADPSPDVGFGIGNFRFQIDDYCGFAIDSRNNTIYLPAQGGHGNWIGNNFNKCGLNADAPAWSIERQPSDPPAIDANYASDGRPASRHGYYTPFVDEARDRVMMLGGYGRAGAGDSFVTSDGFNLLTNDWDPAGTFTSVPMSGASAMAVSRDPATGNVWICVDYRIYRWNPPSSVSGSGNGTFTPITTTLDSQGFGQGYEVASAIDTTRNRFFLVGGIGANGIGGESSRGVLVNMSTNAIAAQTWSGAGSPGGAGNGMGYCPGSDAYWIRKGGAGGAVVRVDANTFEATAPTTSGGGSIPATASGEVHGRWRYARFGDVHGFIYYPEYAANLWFLRTH